MSQTPTQQENSKLVIEKARTFYQQFKIMTVTTSIGQTYDTLINKYKKMLYINSIISNAVRSTLKEPMLRDFIIDDKNIRHDVNSILLLTGINDIILIDVDLYKYKSDDLPDQIKYITRHANSTLSIETINRGIHMYFKVNAEQSNFLKKFKSGQNVGGINGLDIKFHNGQGFFIANSYTVTNSPNELAILPDNIFKIIVNSAQRIHSGKLKHNEILENVEESLDEPQETNGVFRTDKHLMIEELLTCLDPAKFETRQQWIKVAMACKFENIHYSIFDNWSKTCPNYNQENNKIQWDLISDNYKGKPITLGTINLFAKRDNSSLYKSIVAKYAKKEKTETLIKQMLFESMNNSQITNCFNMQQLINDIKNGELKINDIRCTLKISSSICPFINATHNDNIGSRYIHVEYNGIFIKCSHDDCLNEEFPKSPIFINSNHREILNMFERDYCVDNSINDDSDSKDKIKFEHVFDDDELNHYIVKNINSFTNNSVAKLINYLYHNNFLYDFNQLIWYVFKNNKWISVKEPVPIKQLITNNILPLFEQFIAKIKPNYKHLYKHFDNILKSLQSTQFKNNVVSEFNQFYDFYESNRIFDSFNESESLIAFDNGAYDLDNFQFRDLQPTDYITLSTRFNLVPQESKYADQVRQFLADIQPDPEQRDYLLTLLASSLFFRNPDQTFHILTGTGRNGKSKLMELVSLTFGDYYQEIRPDILTGPNPDPYTPQPAFLELKCKRIVTCSEPTSDSKFNTALIKSLIGSDQFSGRKLYSNEIIRFKTKFLLMILCNQKPGVNNPNDHAFWIKCRCIDFPIKFVHNPTKPNEKLRDNNLDKKLPLWRNDFFLILLSYAKRYAENGFELHPTTKIMELSNSYKQDHDFYANFSSEFIVKTDNKKDFIAWSDLKHHFIGWYKNNVSSIHKIDLKKVKSYFEEQFFNEKEKPWKIDGNVARGWICHKLLIEEPDYTQP